MITKAASPVYKSITKTKSPLQKTHTLIITGHRQHPRQTTCRRKNNLSLNFKEKCQAQQNPPYFDILDTTFGSRKALTGIPHGKIATIKRLISHHIA
ncbi:hypothetical protein GX563_09585 [Candidatus Bathyarchaeota archaeon]|nr:hypothetical protein [Candidatus Bathyarchaeota archaeon]